MPFTRLEDLTFLWRETVTYGNATGVVAVIPLTVWQHPNGRRIIVPDNPDHLPYVSKCFSLGRERV